MLIVSDSIDGREEARMRLFNSWFIRIAPEGLIKIDSVSLLEEYCKTMLQ